MKEQIKIPAKSNDQLVLRVTPGHFSSDRFHVNYYIDMSSLKMRQSEAKLVAKVMAEKYVKKVKLPGNVMGINLEAMAEIGANRTPVDTIICMDGCEVIGAYLAEELSDGGFPSNNKHKSFYVITPEFDNTGQMVVRNNIKPMIKGKNVLVVLATAMSGRTISKAIGTILAYGGKVTGLSVIFANVDQVDDYPVYGVFTHEDLPNFKLSDPHHCPDCEAGKSLDAVVNSYGYQML
ncbi:MAG: phosphoribosyltransferase [Beduini sp.]|uniref:phosphoribosyltransferase n=1 Tax=Beduini sp. TaxID=1922300 RepID=UPI0039A1BC3F